MAQTLWAEWPPPVSNFLVFLCDYYLRHLRWVEVMFSLLTVCLCAGYLTKLWTDSDEISWGGLLCVTRTNSFDIGEDRDMDADTIIIKN